MVDRLFFGFLSSRFRKSMERAFTVLTSAIIFSVWASLIFIYSVSGLYSTQGLIIQFSIAIIFLFTIPFFYLLYFYLRGSVDFNVSRRKNRSFFYSFSIFSYIFGSLFFYSFGFTELLFLSLCYVFVTSVIFLFNFWTKVSAHTAGSAGPITAVLLVFGYEWSVLYLIPLFLVYLRRKQEAHSYLQLVLGIIISVFVTYLVYLGFYN